MTSTLDSGEHSTTARAGDPVRTPARGPVGTIATRRTLLALAASALAAFPLKNLLVDNGWLIDVWLSMVIVISPALLLRSRRPPGALDVWPGIALLIPWLTARFVSAHAFLGFLPTLATRHDVAALMNDLHHTTRDDVAPVHSTVAVRLVLCALLALLAALVDLVAVVGHRGALAGVPLLVIYTVSGAVPRQAVSWVWFAVAAVGFLILLGLDAEDELHRWGRRVARRGPSTSAVGGVVSAQRIGVIAVVLAVVLPLVVPAQSRNLITDWIRHGGSGDGSGSGDGTSISPFANLRGQLNRERPIDLFNVHMQTPVGKKPPFYLRTNVLDDYTGPGWRVSDHGQTQPVTGPLTTDPPSTGTRGDEMRVSIKITSATGSPPVFDQPTSLTNLRSSATWSPRDQLLLGTSVHSNDAYQESFRELTPTASDLAVSFGRYADDMSRWTALPDLPASIGDLVTRLTASAKTPYAKARAINDYFTTPTNGFAYSLKTKDGDSRSALVDFLKNKVGFCQQYAAAMAVLLRKAGVPARVVLGYMHPLPDDHGDFTVTSFDAHSWVEAYFKNIGWLPFDPTPVDGLDGGKSSDISYAPHAYPAGGGPTDPRGRNTQLPHGSSSAPVTSPTAAPAAAASTSGTDTGPLWAAGVIGLAVLLALLPAGLRLQRRRRRFAAARDGDPDQLWAELSDTAVDLGYVWSAARSPRQVASWLERDARSPDALTALAQAVERHRYGSPPDPDAPPPYDVGALTENLERVTRELRSQRNARTRLAARFWPASLGLGSRVRGIGRRR